MILKIGLKNLMTYTKLAFLSALGVLKKTFSWFSETGFDVHSIDPTLSFCKQKITRKVKFR